MGTTQRNFNVFRNMRNRVKTSLNVSRAQKKGDNVLIYKQETTWKRITSFLFNLFRRKKKVEFVETLPRAQKREFIKSGKTEEEFKEYHGRKAKQVHRFGGLKCVSASNNCIFEPKRKKFKGYLTAV